MVEMVVDSSVLPLIHQQDSGPRCFLWVDSTDVTYGEAFCMACTDFSANLLA